MLEELFITLPDLPDHEVVQQYAERHPSSNAKRTEDPAWAVVCIVLGAWLCIGFGAFFIALGLS